MVALHSWHTLMFPERLLGFTFCCAKGVCSPYGTWKDSAKNTTLSVHSVEACVLHW